MNKFTPISRMGKKCRGISDADILKSYLGLLALGKSDYAAITDKKNDTFFKMSLGISHVPSEPTLRQRLHRLAKEIYQQVKRLSVDFLRKSKAPISALDTGHIPLDIDGFALDNSGTYKEGVSRTYRNFDGYMVMPAYLGLEGWSIACDLHPGNHHSQKDFCSFLDKVIKDARRITKKPLLCRLDSAHDSKDTRATLHKYKDVSYVIKWNPRGENTSVLEFLAFKHGVVTQPRPGKQVAIMRIEERETVDHKEYKFYKVIRVIRRTIDKKGQKLLHPEVRVEGWRTDLDLNDEKVIKLYEGHGLSEQFHSEFKSDLDVERLPSGKFDTNALVIALAGLVYNILRYIGLVGLRGGHSPVRHPAKRRRIKTVIQELIYLASRLISTGRSCTLRFGRNCLNYCAFHLTYERIACT